MTTLTLTSSEVEDLCDIDEMREAMRSAHAAISAGRAMQPAPHALGDADDDRADAPAVVPMMALSHELGLFATKVLADAPRNRERGLPAQRSTVALFDSQSAECLALIDGRALTRIRTAAVTAFATDALAVREARVVTLIGAGPLAVEHARALVRVRRFEQVRVWSRDIARAEQAVKAMKDMGVPALARAVMPEALADADVVCTLTPATHPFLSSADLAREAHVNAIGSPPRPAYSEVRPDVFRSAATVVVDDRAVACAESGNVRAAIEAGAISASGLVELGDAVAAVKPRAGRTIFNSVGLGVQDLYAAALLVRRAEQSGTGTMVTIRT